MKGIFAIGMWLVTALCFGQLPNDCLQAITVCAEGTYNSNAFGFGEVQEVNSCGLVESNSIWLRFQTTQSGDLNFTIVPLDENLTTDYNFWVFGPTTDCGYLGEPIRCSAVNPEAANLVSNHTGLSSSATATSEGNSFLGTGFVRSLQVEPGQTYFLAINRPENDPGFHLNWSGSATENDGGLAGAHSWNPIPNQQQCSVTGGPITFDLVAAVQQANADFNPALHTLEFYANLADATDGLNPLPEMYTATGFPQTIYLGIKAAGSRCRYISSFQLAVISPEVDWTIARSSACLAGQYTVNVTGTPAAIVHYTNGATAHTLQLDENGLAQFELSITTETQLELLRVELQDADGNVTCSREINRVETLSPDAAGLVVPTITAPEEVCMGELATIVFTGSPFTQLTYHIYNDEFTGVLDAQGQLTVTHPVEFSTLIRISHVGAAGGDADCEMDVDIRHIINPIPAPALLEILSYTVCQDGFGYATINMQNIFNRLSTNNQYVFTAYATYEQAVANDPAVALPMTYTLSSSANIYVHVVGNNGCSVIAGVPITVVQVPSFEYMNPLRACVTPGAQTGRFNLSEVRNTIIHTIFTSMSINFYHTIEDANANQNVIVIALDNELAAGNLYVKLGFDECTIIMAFDVELSIPPPIKEQVNYAKCFEQNPGYAQFDLTSRIAEITYGADPATYAIQFYDNRANAEYFTAAFISNPAAYMNQTANEQIIYAAVQDAETGCVSISEIKLEVINPIEVPTVRIAYGCDTSLDGQTVFNLLDYTAVIMPGVTNPQAYQFQFFTSEAAAQANDLTQLLPQQYAIPTAIRQVIGVRFFHEQAGCAQATSMQLYPLQLPEVNTDQIAPQRACATSLEDTTHEFDLRVYESVIRGALPNISISYHPTLADAEQGINAIDANQLFSTETTTVYIRVISTEVTAVACAPLVYPMELQVIPIPRIYQNNFTICDPFTNGYTTFNLQSQILGILGQQPNDQYTVRFYVDADLTQWIATPTYANTTATEQFIYVEITHTASGCAASYPFKLRVQTGLQVTPPSAIVVCDDPQSNDGFQQFDLLSQESTVLTGLDPNEYAITYHLSFADAEAGWNAIANPQGFTNTVVNEQTVYVRVKGLMPSNDCYTVLPMQLRVQRLIIPQILSVDNHHTLCVNFETGEVERTLTLRSNLVEDSYAYQWYYNGQPIAEATSSSYTITTAAAGAYTVSVVNTTAEITCEGPQSAVFEVALSSAPVLVDYTTSNPFEIENFIQINVAGYGQYSYQLNDGAVVNNGGVFTNVPAGVHTVYVYDNARGDLSCGMLEVTDIVILDYPRFFTPNGDGWNDFWTIPYLQDQPEAKVQIFDRYGKLLFQLQPATQLGWDGTVNGALLPATDYWFLVYFEHLGQWHTYRSHFSLKR